MERFETCKEISGSWGWIHGMEYAINCKVQFSNQKDEFGQRKHGMRDREEKNAKGT